MSQRRCVTLVVKTRDAQFDLDTFLHVLEVLAELVWELVTAKSRGRRGQGDIPAAVKIHDVPERDPVVVVVLVGELEDTALELGMTSADCRRDDLTSDWSDEEGTARKRPDGRTLLVHTLPQVRHQNVSRHLDGVLGVLVVDAEHAARASDRQRRSRSDGRRRRVRGRVGAFLPDNRDAALTGVHW